MFSTWWDFIHAFVVSFVDDVTRESEVADLASETVVKKNVACSQVTMKQLKDS